MSSVPAEAGQARPAGAPVFDRILLKLSGEALMGGLEYGIDGDKVTAIARQIKHVHDRGVQIAVVLGAGNIYRGIAAPRPAWTAPPRTTWGCWPSSSTR